MSRQRVIVCSVWLALATAGCERGLDPAVGVPDRGKPRILSAYFGLDEEPVPATSLRNLILRLRCAEDGLLDGIPLVVSHEIDQSSVARDGSDFVVVTASGRRLQPNCATLRPAHEENEDRTILLLGELGGPEDPPAFVEVVGSVRTEPAADGRPSDLRGLRSPRPRPLDGGPVLVLAEHVGPAELELSDGADGRNCPPETKQVVRIIWSGGVSQRAEGSGNFPRGAGSELGPEQYGRIQVILKHPDGTREFISPFYVGDRDDGDNNNDLCLDREERPVRVKVMPWVVTDPGNDGNPATTREVS